MMTLQEALEKANSKPENERTPEEKSLLEAFNAAKKQAMSKLAPKGE